MHNKIIMIMCLKNKVVNVSQAHVPHTTLSVIGLQGLAHVKPCPAHANKIQVPATVAWVLRSVACGAAARRTTHCPPGWNSGSLRFHLCPADFSMVPPGSNPGVAR